MKKVYSYLRSYLFWAVVSPLMMVGEVACDLILPYIMSFIIDFGISGISLPECPLLFQWFVPVFFQEPYDRMRIMLLCGVLMIFITLLGGFCGTFSAYTSSRAAQGMGFDIRKDAYANILSLSLEQTDQFTTASLVTRMTNDINTMLEGTEFLLKSFVRSPLFLIGGTVMLFIIHAGFGLLLLCCIPVLLGFIVTLFVKALPRYEKIQKLVDLVNSIVRENINGARTVKAFVNEKHECDRFDGANTDLKEENYSVLRMMASINPVMTVLSNLLIAAVIYLGAGELSMQVGSVGMIMAAITYLTLIVQAVFRSVNSFQIVSRSMVSAKRVEELLKVTPKLQREHTEPQPETDNETEPAVSFRHVTFQYPGSKGKPVLLDICLDVKKGESLAIIGATGSGKTTLLNLIPRFYDASEGEVLVGGRPAKSYSLSELRQKISYVMQKSELFSGTVKENILWGNLEASDSEVERSARIAQIDDFIQSTREGYDKYVEERGMSLSGGQKQRLSIARGLLRKPEILLMDDSVSALDVATEAKLQAALKEEDSFRGMTRITVAQRISSVLHADRIAVLEDDGRILHCGTHEELLKESATYRAIFASQMAGNEGGL